MSIPIASLYCGGGIDVFYDMLAETIVYEPHDACSLTHTYNKIVDVPNINIPLYELGSLYVILQCCGWHNGISPNGIFSNDYSCILKTYKGNLKREVHALSCPPYSAMMQVTCNDMDAYLLNIAQSVVKQKKV